MQAKEEEEDNSKVCKIHLIKLFFGLGKIYLNNKKKDNGIIYGQLLIYERQMWPHVESKHILQGHNHVVSWVYMGTVLF